MGQFPLETITSQCRPFVNVAIDFASGLMVHQLGRGRKPVKVYALIVVCTATHAIHLELVGDLSSAAFIAALRRFIGRRGLCRTIFCDNATNFVAADRELRQMIRLTVGNGKFDDAFHEQGIKFKFSPANSPHFNGLAEAGVKSMKKQLRVVAGTASLTYEEMNTLLIQIEAALNSRPLSPLSEDPSELEALTPAHFVLGSPITSFLEPPDDSKLSLLTRYYRLRLILQHFWKRWWLEYVLNRQRRKKWTASNANIPLGQLVILIDDNLKPLYWPLGRVTATHPDKDGVVRVVDVTTPRGTVRRAVHRLCPVPLTLHQEQAIEPQQQEDVTRGPVTRSQRRQHQV